MSATNLHYKSLADAIKEVGAMFDENVVLTDGEPCEVLNWIVNQPVPANIENTDVYE